MNYLGRALPDARAVPAPTLDAGVCQWFAVYTASKHEKKVGMYFDMTGIESYLPTYCSRRKWKNGQRPMVALPLFPNYIFVRLNRHQRGSVLATPGVLHIVGGSKPTPLSEFEIETLRSGLQSRAAEPHPYLVEGSRVRIMRGPLAGLEGVFGRSKGQSRLVITLTGVMRSIAVEVEEEEIGPVA